MSRENIEIAKELVLDLNALYANDIRPNADVVASQRIAKALDKKDDLIRELVEALKNIENDDGSIPETIWNIRCEALTKAKECLK